MENSWTEHLKKAVSHGGQIEIKDEGGEAYIIDWKKGDILSPDLAAFKKNICALAVEELAPVELQFLHANPDAASEELFLSSCAPLLEGRADNVDWKAIEKKIRSTIEQFYLADLSKFGEAVIKPLLDDVYFLAELKNKSEGALCGFLLFAATPALKFGHIKVINFVVSRGLSNRGLENALMHSIFEIVPEARRLFLFVRPTNEYAIQMYDSMGFMPDLKPFQDPNHKININHLIPLEYEVVCK